MKLRYGVGRYVFANVALPNIGTKIPSLSRVIISSLPP